MEAWDGGAPRVVADCYSVPPRTAEEKTKPAYIWYPVGNPGLRTELAGSEWLAK